MTEIAVAGLARLPPSSSASLHCHQLREGLAMIIESLESRRHFDVTVTEMYPGFYAVAGDQHADDINISVSMNEETFTLNETTYSGVACVYVSGNGGSDNITVSSVDGAGSIGASITGDDGDDTISLNFDGGVWAGSGNDVLYLSDSFRGAAYGDGGNDEIYISGACYEAEISGDSGNDLIDCSQNYYAVEVHAGSGNDTVYGSAYNDAIYGEGGQDQLYGNAGNDLFFANDGPGGLVDGGGGYDIIATTGTPPPNVAVEYIYTM
jgi:Ca2+-binding RTX toxin-like protein